MEQGIKNLQEIINLCNEELDNEDENVTAVLDLVDLKSLRNLINRNKELEEENRYLKTHIIYPEIIKLNFIPVSLVEEKLEKEKLPNIIVGGRRNDKTLEYGKKLGRIEMCEELLEKRK